MRDLNTSGDHYGDIYVNEGRDYVPYNEASDELLALEDVRLKGNLKAIRRARLRPAGIGYVAGFVVLVAGLWWVNSLDAALVGIIGVAAGALTLYLTFQIWGQPNVDEQNIVEGIETIRQERQYRRTLFGPGRGGR